MTVATYAKAYDDPAYRQPDPLEFTISAGSGTLSQKYVSFCGRQLKSVTMLPTTAAEASDVVTLVQVTSLPVNFVGTSGTAAFSSGTSTVTLTNLGTFGSGSTTPQTLGISGGVFTITVVNGTTTSTATGVTLPSGPNGGLTVAALDSFWIKHGTSTAVVYVGEIETAFTPGTSFTL